VTTPVISNLGICAYQEVWQKMREFTERRNLETADEIWLLQHYPVFTQGQAGSAKHVLNPGDIPIIKTDRGGQVTYHGPGQLIIYPLINLQRIKLGVKLFVNILQKSTIQLLADYKIAAQVRVDAPGVYVNDAKICSIGLKIRRGCSYHGIALNVNMDLEPFTRINPCGIKNLQMAQISDYVNNISFLEVEERIVKYLVENLGYKNE
jgi:lipoyl(octanoyl) transferase